MAWLHQGAGLCLIPQRHGQLEKPFAAKRLTDETGGGEFW
jgi:hypothetical protein